MPRRKSYHFDRYARVFEYMAGQYNIPLQGAYAPPGYDEGKQQEFTLRYETKDYVLDEQIPTVNDDSTQEEIEAHQKHYDDANKVSCIMASSMSPELQKNFENTWAYERNQQLKEMFQKRQARNALMLLESLNMMFDTELSINIILSCLPADYNQFVLSYQMNRKNTSIMELHSLLQTAGQGIKKINAAKGKFDRRSKGKVESEIAPISDPKEAVCFYCNTKGHWKHSGLKYLKDLKDGKVEKVSHSWSKGKLETEAWRTQLSHDKQENHTCNKDWKVRAHAEVWKGKISDSTLSELDEPANYNEAMVSPEAAKWKEAMKSEIQSMYDNQVWNLVDITPDLKTVGCKWIFKNKTDMDGKVHTYKVRLVAKGYTQTHGIDYEETFSPVAKIKSNRIMLAIAAFHDFKIWQMDVKTGFLNGKLTEDVFMTQPEGFENAKHPKRFGFSKSEDKSCMYIKVSGSVVVFLVLYVDDILLKGNDIPTLQCVKDWLRKCFAMKYLGDVTYILGIKIYRDRSKRLIGLSQDTYLDKNLKRFKMENSKKGNLPSHHGIKISKDPCPKTDEELDRMSQVLYASAIGSIMYAMMYTRSDVSFALSMVSQHQQNPGEGHWTAVKNIFKYLRNTKDMFWLMSGWIFLLNEEAVTWKSLKQDTVADSTCESEYIAACEASKEASWMKNFIGDLGVVPTIQDPIEIFCHNKSAVSLTKEPKDHRKSKHIERKYHFVRSKVEEGHMIVKHIRL
ncbi:putative RNA-directed DNA polymerase [Tanacetum coccineum]